MPSRGDADAEWTALTTEAGRALLAEVAATPTSGPADLARWRRAAPPEVVAAAVRLAESRRRARPKFSRAGEMWLEPVALEQATPEPVARRKAARFEGISVDLCCGIGGDALALAAAPEARVLAVDLDPGNARRAAWNAGVYGAAGRVLAVRARAEAFPIPPDALVHVDPDRRSGPGPRSKSIHGYAPGLPFLLALPGRVRGGAIKLGPASDFGRHFGGPGFEVELLSLGGECKEATAWFGAPATPGVGRRATTLPAGATWTDRDGPAGVSAPALPPDRWVFDPDPALGRAGLLDGFALALGLARLEGGSDLLTGPARLDSPWLAAFEVREVLPADRKRLRRLVAERGLGPLEIKVRGLDVAPESLRAELRPPGPTPAALLLVASARGRPALAILAERPPAGPAVSTLPTAPGNA